MANQVVNTTVIGDYITEKLGNNVRFMPLAKVTNVGSTDGIYVFKRGYIGDAQIVPAGQLIPKSDFKQEKVLVPIEKLANRVEMTEEELLSAYGNPAEDIQEQLLASIEQALDKAMVAELSAISGAMVHDAKVAGKIDGDVMADALGKFGEDQSASFLMVNSATLTQMRKENDFVRIAGDEYGAVGEIFGARVINSDAVPAGEAYVVKEGALALYIRKDVKVKEQEDITREVTDFTGTVYFGATLLNEDKAVKIDLV